MAWEFCTQGASFVGSPCREKYLLVSSDWLTRICGLKNHAFLFLYSETDAVSPSDKIEMVANYLRCRENRVSLVRFEGSEHVLHYYMYPQEYLSAVSTFIRNALESYDRPPTYWDECH
ncbi:unnamed protein product [Allacma fusca]|uniref:Uncharacterized protein n=1 Tax=Allacma fusca TaxID=39272 RepID=A0A8J2PHL6_9HEXA|nr:unnamed protein product [Allacma fusca]